ncbi:HAD-like domain-containing protein [Zopfochytrium polystomum]|nr:HAD-like domain-containing protein [Zopfochytrium polystomum]
MPGGKSNLWKDGAAHEAAVSLLPASAASNPFNDHGIPSYSTADLARLSELAEDEFLERLQAIRDKKAFICDMDGVVYHGSVLLPGVKEFVSWLKKENKKFLFLTNNSAPTPKELSEKLRRMGLDVSEEHFFTSAMSTANFLKSQRPKGGSCYVIGEPGLTYALYEAGFSMDSEKPDYVVVGEGTSHNFEKITKACNLVLNGAKLISTNPDTNGNSSHGMVPGCGAFVATIELATGKKAFTCGKPTSLMMRFAQQLLGTDKNETCIVGDRMDTDILAGTFAMIDPVLVMSGVTNISNLFDDAYRPFLVLNGIGEVAGFRGHLEEAAAREAAAAAAAGGAGSNGSASN